MTEQDFILVTGATGMQGGFVAHALLRRGIKIRALVWSDMDSPAARRLADAGADLFQGDLGDRDSLKRAATGASGVFSVQVPSKLPDDPLGELRQGLNLVQAAYAAGVSTFVHSSVARTGEYKEFVGWDEGRWHPDYWVSKSCVNEAVKVAGFAHWLVLKPASILETWLPPKVDYVCPSLARGRWETAIEPGVRQHLVAMDDVAAFAAAMFSDPSRFDRQEISLATDALTMEELAGIFSEVTGKPIPVEHVTVDEMVARGMTRPVAESQAWDNVEGYKVDLEKAAAWGIPLESVRSWAERHVDVLKAVVGPR
ncbi:NmrA family NAD(P)-binding protein [Pleomorphomonas carboxyditropha]|uniref:NmrA-like domain-containing protein n=1 Tax=Pleomorphomonas carboxyditropha TaxID=2023338 RepID=A0A2G9WSE8_9HYPH|nr:NmrA family NAD(P)-binding protein [Pleomorphomonas carboxyditropha]PIO97060.1 hypothetical protein CJ014_22435 [Pleomorphomonas carboxyditropha]